MGNCFESVMWAVLPGEFATFASLPLLDGVGGLMATQVMLVACALLCMGP